MSLVASGVVYLVGAGPGDPGLMTLRGRDLLAEADVVVYDRLVSKAVLDMAPTHALRIYAGKTRNDHYIRQEDINALLARHAKAGATVVRLKGGDPFTFGRGGEEIETLVREGVRFEVVPGVTAASGCAAYAGIPLTHRDCAHACLFVAGVLKEGSVALDWPTLARPGQTVVIYMSLSALDVICRELVAHGMPSDTPIALVAEGTTPTQEVIIGTLADLPTRVERANVRTPTLTIVGEVVRLRERLGWFAGEAHGMADPFHRHGRERDAGDRVIASALDVATGPCSAALGPTASCARLSKAPRSAGWRD